MKNKFFHVAAIALFFLESGPSLAQDPDWEWAFRIGGTGTEKWSSVATDPSGNVFVSGYFQSSSLMVGSQALTRTGSGNAFLAKYDHDGNVLWADSPSGTVYDIPYTVATDSQGNAVMAGTSSSPVMTVGSFSLTMAGNGDAFIAKYDPSGNVLWAKQAGGTERESANAVAIDADGNVFMTGEFRSASITFDTITLTNLYPGIDDVFLVKYDAAGNVQWAREAGGPGSNRSVSMSVDQSGNVCITGTFTGTHMTFDSQVILNNGQNDIFVAMYNASGNIIWANGEGTSEYESGYAIALDGKGHVYLAGMFNSESITFGTITLQNLGGWIPTADICLIKYDTLGHVVWAVNAGGIQNDQPASVTTDAEGNVYMTGLFNSDTATFGSVRLVNASYQSDLFLVKYDPEGVVGWAIRAGGTGSDAGSSVSCDALGYLYLTGNFDSPFLVLGADTLNTAGDSDLFLAKLSNDITGTDESYRSERLTIFPNPATSHICISRANEITGTLTIYNPMGLPVHRKTLTGLNNTIDISTLKPGLYEIQIIRRHGVSTGKFVRQ